MKKIELNLSDAEYESLKYRLKYDKNWRIRERIESLLLLSSGLSCEKVGLEQGLSRKIIESTRSGWLKEKARAGEIELAYLDEAGFSCVHPNRNAWTTVGEQH